MQAYIKSFAAFRTIYQRHALDYDLVLDALPQAKGSVTLQGDDIPRTCAGGFLLINGGLYLISLVTPDNGATKLSLLSPVDLFDRQRPYAAPAAGETVGGFIVRELLAGWRHEPDGAYAMPYLSVSSMDTTPFVAPEVDDNGLYRLSDYLRTVRSAYGVETVFSARGDTLHVTVRRTSPQLHALVPGDGHTALKSSSWSRSSVAKITAVQPVDTGEVDENGEKIFERRRVDWYLAKDGSVSTEVPAARADGEWITTVISEKADMAEAVASAFAKNGESHKVEFWSDRRLQVRDRFNIRLYGQVFSGEISAVSRKAGDRRYLYQSGTLATTLSDKVRAASGGSGGAGPGQIYAVGDVFITTRPGNPAALLGYGAWEQLQGRFLFAADSARPAGSRGGQSSHTLTEAELPPHKHRLSVDGRRLYTTLQKSPGAGSDQYGVLGTGGSNDTSEVGGGQSFEIIPPYYALYVWIRKE